MAAKRPEAVWSLSDFLFLEEPLFHLWIDTAGSLFSFWCLNCYRSWNYWNLWNDAKRYLVCWNDRNFCHSRCVACRIVWPLRSHGYNGSFSCTNKVWLWNKSYNTVWRDGISAFSWTTFSVEPSSKVGATVKSTSPSKVVLPVCVWPLSPSEGLHLLLVFGRWPLVYTAL